MILEAVCGRCGENYTVPDLQHTRHRVIYGNVLCNGLPKRIFEVHESFTTLQNAILRRYTHPKKVYPLLKFRPIPFDPNDGEVNIQLKAEVVSTPKKPKSRWQRWLDNER